MSETSKAKKILGILGLILALAVFSVGGFIVFIGFSTVKGADIMIKMRAEATVMVDYKCNVCGLTGSIADGLSQTRDGEECGYISGKGVRCRGRYKTKLRSITEADRKELQEDIEIFENQKAMGQPMFNYGILAMIASILMAVGAGGALLNQLWGLPSLGLSLVAALTGLALGGSAIIDFFASM